MLPESNGSPYAGGDAPKLRTACENCRQSKVKCNLSGKNVCTRCLRHGLQCQYGFANRSGKPKGSKNRATLRKLGQLQEDKPPLRGIRGNRIVPPVSDREPLATSSYAGHIIDPVLEEDVCLISSPLGFWESPRSLSSSTVLENPICPSQFSAVDNSSFSDMVDSCPTLPLGLAYPHSPVTPTFLPPDGISSPPLTGSMSSPFSAVSCDCVDMQMFHMNRLNHLLAESLPLRFDHSLQTIKATFCACQVFLQCNKCTKDSPGLLLSISVLNSTLQLFEYWISGETTRATRMEHGFDIRYGYYEVCQSESRQIRTFLLRGLLLQCREVLSMLATAANATHTDPPKLGEVDDSVKPSLNMNEVDSHAWWTPEQFGIATSDLDLEALGSGGNCLLPIIAGFEATVGAFLRSISANECICGSKCRRDESV
ncbi:hypothetical protein N7512_009219 [Penicillium capsulatum]|nr:hypothetical protein N7512_009219 [Penicillium capsulatum]